MKIMNSEFCASCNLYTETDTLRDNKRKGKEKKGNHLTFRLKNCICHVLKIQCRCQFPSMNVARTMLIMRILAVTTRFIRVYALLPISD